MSTEPENPAAASMVDVTAKEVVARTARARARMTLDAAHWEHWTGSEFAFPKGGALAVAAVAAVMAAKKTPEIVPLCHPLPLGAVTLDHSADPEEGTLELTVSVKAHYRTGVEMEALTAASAAALTVWDLAKNVSHRLRIDGIELLEKTKNGGSAA